LFLSCFFQLKTFAQSKKKKADKESSAKVETKGADIKKEPKPYKKDSTAVTQED
jgi:hypothetical protein